MEFRWEPYFHDPTIRRVAKVGVWLPVALVVWNGWRTHLWPTSDLLLSAAVVLASVAALGSRPVVRCDGCAYTANAS
jgi:hypothetical protein